MAVTPHHLALLLASWVTSPLMIVVVLSVVIGLLMIVLFGYTSDQKAIGIAKDQLKAHLLAVRIYRDQLHVVMGSYGKVLRGTGRYLKLAFKPLLYVLGLQRKEEPVSFFAESLMAGSLSMKSVKIGG